METKFEKVLLARSRSPEECHLVSVAYLLDRDKRIRLLTAHIPEASVEVNRERSAKLYERIKGLGLGCTHLICNVQYNGLEDIERVLNVPDIQLPDAAVVAVEFDQLGFIVASAEDGRVRFAEPERFSDKLRFTELTEGSIESRLSQAYSLNRERELLALFEILPNSLTEGYQSRLF